MLIVLLRFVFYTIYFDNNSLTATCNMAAQIFVMDARNVAKVIKTYLKKCAATTTDYLPVELSRLKCGWGDESFTVKNDNYCVVKDEHLKTVQAYITERNTSMKGMCTVNSIIAHSYQKFGILFRYRTIHYALKTRLGLKYKTPLKSLLVFSEGRTKFDVTFVKDLDYALKEERAGRAIIVYMDESYCHTNHMSRKGGGEMNPAVLQMKKRCTRQRQLLLLLLLLLLSVTDLCAGENITGDHEFSVMSNEWTGLDA